MNSCFALSPPASTPVTTKSCVLILEDDRQLLGMMSAELAKNGYEVLSAAGEQDFRSHLNNPKFEVVILDLALDGDAYKGLNLVREIRNARNIPIIVVSAHAQPWDRLRALEMGIDDYITKPFLIKELLIRLKRVLQIYKAEESGAAGYNPVVVFSRFQLDPVRRSVQTAEGVAIDLTETEFNILRMLAHAAGRIVTRDELWRRLRGQAWSPLDRALDGHVARLRAKLEPGVERSQIIKSARGIGYLLAVPVSSVPS
jgi:two-component system, OmpR family, response regulator